MEGRESLPGRPGPARLLLLLPAIASACAVCAWVFPSLVAPVALAVALGALVHAFFSESASGAGQGTASPEEGPLAAGKDPFRRQTPLAQEVGGAVAQDSASDGVGAPAVLEDAAKAGRYLDAQGVSPGARAMAAAMKAKASRAAAAQAAKAAVLVQNTAAANTALEPTPSAPGQQVVVLFGSQTGNAAEIAKSINAEAVQRGLSSSVCSMNELSLDKLRSASVGIFVVSSTGDGDPPENCDRMVSAIQRRSLPSNMLAGLKYTVCGLGDSNYTRFMHIPRIFTRRLPELGAQPFFKCCEADEVDGLEDIVEKWTSELWNPLLEAVKNANGSQQLSPLAPPSLQQPKEELEKLVGVAPLQPCRLRLIWREEAQQAAAGAAAAPADGQLRGPPAGYTVERPFQARVVRAQRLTADWSDHCVLHVDLSLEGWAMPLPRAGDCVGVHAANMPALVDALLARLQVSGEKQFVLESLEGGQHCAHIPSPCTFRQALMSHCDVTGVAKKGFLRILSEYCSDARERHILMLLSSRSGKEKYKEWVVDARPGLLELLNAFPSCKPDPGHLLEALPPLANRFYSLSCSPAAAAAGSSAGESKAILSFAFSVVKEQLPGAPSWVQQTGENSESEAVGRAESRLFRGVCTAWLEQLLQGHLQEQPCRDAPVSLPIYPRAGGSFSHPSDLAAPIIMIGPGTGVAPFRGFLQEREAALAASPQTAAGESWLFFGCRQEHEDYLYKADLEKFVGAGVLSHLVLAFSRAPENAGKKVYVQHKMEEHAQALGGLLFNPSTFVFVCGDGAEMVKGVHAALLRIVQNKSGCRESDAIAHMGAMVHQGRYIRDVWS